MSSHDSHETVDRVGDMDLSGILRSLGKYVQDWRHVTAVDLGNRFGLGPVQANRLVEYILYHPTATLEELTSVIRGYSGR